MTVKIGFLMDDIGSINPKKDSTLAMLLAAQSRGWQLHYMEQSDLYLHNGEVRAGFSEIEVFDDLEKWFEMGIQGDCAAKELDIVLMRKDPPFDMEYIYSTYLLERLESAGMDSLCA
jgi:glutathione synthase